MDIGRNGHCLRTAGMIAVLLLLFAALHVPGVDVAAASTALNLYQARTIVTGQREETRGPGLQRCLEDVLVKVSGDPLVLADPAIAGMKGHAASYVAGFRYREIIRRLKALGLVFHRQAAGSHEIWFNPARKRQSPITPEICRRPH